MLTFQRLKYVTRLAVRVTDVVDVGTIAVQRVGLCTAERRECPDCSHMQFRFLDCCRRRFYEMARSHQALQASSKC